MDLSLDKSTYMVGEHIAVALDFSKLNQDTAVIVVMNSDAESGEKLASITIAVGDATLPYGRTIKC